METALIKAETLGEMVAKYNQQLCDLEALQPYYEKAKSLLCSRGRDSCDSVDWETTFNKLQKNAWNDVFIKTNLYQLMSVADAEKIQKALWNDEPCQKIGLPSFTVENVIAFMDAKTAQMPDMFASKVEEVYKILRPRNYYQLKTNATSLLEGIGKKVILSYMFEPNYSGGLRISYRKEQELNAIQAVFWLFDGKGVPAHEEKLYHKLYGSQRAESYEDEYFRIKGYINGNMHLEFKRMDIVGKIMMNIKEHILSWKKDVA